MLPFCGASVTGGDRNFLRAEFAAPKGLVKDNIRPPSFNSPFPQIVPFDLPVRSFDINCGVVHFVMQEL
jgi:hypothetical protein